MRTSCFYIADGKIFYHKDGEPERAIPSGILDTYIEKVKESAARSEWKTSGAGAAFTGTYVANADAGSRVAATNANVFCLGRHENALVYGLSIDGACGIYRKAGMDDRNEGIVISDNTVAYREFDIVGDRMAVAARFAGESHIGVMTVGNPKCDFYTDGHSLDTEPVQSRAKEGEIYFCTAGLLVRNEKEESVPGGDGMPTYPQMYRQMMTENEAASNVRGPSSICVLNTNEGTMTELLSEDGVDFLHPQSTADGSLYYIRRPYRQEKTNVNPLGCVVDILLFPFRMIGALFGFFNLFSMKYSGKSLSRTGDVKNRTEDELYIDGNMIRAGKELKENRARGEREPGIIPHSWELHRRRPDGTDELIRRGVVAYRVDEEGNVLFSNGSAVLCRTPGGEERKLFSQDRVTFIF